MQVLPNQTLNLPIDTVYYIAGSDEKLNAWMAENMERAMHSFNIDNAPYFDYHFEYLSLNSLTDSDLRKMLRLQFPDSSEPILDALLAQTKSNLDAFKYSGSYNLVVRLLPANTDDCSLLTAQILYDSARMQVQQFLHDLILHNGYLLENESASTAEPELDADIRFKINTVQNIEYDEDSTCEKLADKKSRAHGFFPGKIAKRLKRQESMPMECYSMSEEDSLRAQALKIRDEIAELQRKNGINILIEMLGKDFLQTMKELPVVQPSNLVITNDFDITLPAYHQTVRMNALSKSLYFLFLIYPEGIRLKDLANYRHVLLDVYKLVSNRENPDKMTDSIAELTNPLSNSVNEKLSRIRAAFCDVMAQDLAQEYIPYGLRGEEKHIALDKDKISLPESLLKLRK